MRSFIALLVMIVWSTAIAVAMDKIGFEDHIYDLWWSFGAAIVLLIGLVGNVWIFFLVVKETPWAWFKSGNRP